MGRVETAGRAQCYPALEEWDSWKSPHPSMPQTEPCWLSIEDTWRHDERPADSWGTGRCQGNRGSSHVTPARPSSGQQTCRYLGKAAWKSENEGNNFSSSTRNRLYAFYPEHLLSGNRKSGGGAPPQYLSLPQLSFPQSPEPRAFIRILTDNCW